MSTIDEKYLGDRIKALEENITAMKYVVPKSPNEATINDDVFISLRSATTQNLEIYNDYTVDNNTIILNGASPSSIFYMYFKKSAFNISSEYDLLTKIKQINIAYSSTYSAKESIYLNYANNNTVHSDYICYSLQQSTISSASAKNIFTIRIYINKMK